MRKVNIYEAQARLSELIEEAASGHDVVIVRAGRPVARLTRLAAPRHGCPSGVARTGGKRRLGVLDGRFRIPDDFNRPLPGEVLRAFEND